MDLHLPLVLATPTLLGLAAAVAALLWPRRSVLWPFLLPLWLIAASFHGLLACRGEIVGPAVHWFRLDAPGIRITMVAGPLAALAVWRLRAVPVVAALRGCPWRLALLHAGVAASGMLPWPGVPLVAFVVGGLEFRAPAARTAAILGTAAALLVWPWPAWADAASAAAAVGFAAALRPVPAARVWWAAALLQAVLGGLRAAGVV